MLTYSSQGAAADVRVENARFHAGGVRGELLQPLGQWRVCQPAARRFQPGQPGGGGSRSGAGRGGSGQCWRRWQASACSRTYADYPNDLGLQVIVDYAHTPDALEQVLRRCKAHVQGALVTVFGCGGDRDREKRQVMGRVACALSDRVIVTSDNPRSEDPLHIMRDIATGCSGDYAWSEDRAEAIAQALRKPSPGTVWLLPAKGMRTTSSSTASVCISVMRRRPRGAGAEG